MGAKNVAQRTCVVLGNWKMHGTLDSNAALLTALRTKISAFANAVDLPIHANQGALEDSHPLQKRPKSTLPHAHHETGLPAESFLPRTNCEIGICVPFPYLAQAQTLLQGSPISWGAQDISVQEKGAYTGEVSGAMLAEFGARWVLVGHSERRMMHGENNVLVAAKVQAALAAGLIPVLCVGETAEEYKKGKTLDVIQKQLAPVLALGAAALKRLVVAYEPVWAIGGGQAANPDQVQPVHQAIRVTLRAAGMPHGRVLYGGSVKTSNVVALWREADIDGVLVGSASRAIDEFLGIVERCSFGSE